jgi:hypothetical protein
MKKAALPLSLLAALCACSEPSLSVYDAPKDILEMPAPPPSAGETVRWKTPSGWKEQPASGMRLATYLVPTAAGQGELSVVRLAGEAGGDLANVNRWRGQIGLKPLDSLAGQIKTVAAPAGEVRLVDFTGSQDKRIAGAVLTDGSGSLFFKLTGSKAAVAAAKPAFLAFLRSLRRGRP